MKEYITIEIQTGDREVNLAIYRRVEHAVVTSIAFASDEIITHLNKIPGMHFDPANILANYRLAIETGILETDGYRSKAILYKRPRVFVILDMFPPIGWFDKLANLMLARLQTILPFQCSILD